MPNELQALIDWQALICKRGRPVIMWNMLYGDGDTKYNFYTVRGYIQFLDF